MLLQLRGNPIGSLVLVGALALLGCGGGEDHGDDPAREADTMPAQPEVTQSATTVEGSSVTSQIGQEPSHLGAPLREPERYYGLYANPETPDRQWFVIEAKRSPYAEQAPEVPPGHLAVGAMFGDVEPWHLRTLSETDFEQAWVGAGQAEPIAVRFELDGNGDAVAMAFITEPNAAEGRLERQGDLPADW